MTGSSISLGRGVAVVVLLSSLLASIGMLSPVGAGSGSTITLKPTSGLAGSTVRVYGTGFGKTGKVAVLWDGDQISDAVTEDGAFEAIFQAPNDSPGNHKVGVCVTEIDPCDAGEASTEFTLRAPTPTPTKTHKPTNQPTIRPPTAPPTAPPPVITPSPTVQPPPIIEPPFEGLPPVPWLQPRGGPCTSVPFSGPTRTIDFETNPPASLGWALVGQRATPPAGARSGTMGFGSTYDDFGSTGRPISIDFGVRAESELALFVGREQPRPGSGEVVAVLTGFGLDSNGRMVELARVQRVLEEAAIPTTRCLHLIAPSGRLFRAISVEYFDSNDESAYERRWIDDVVLRGSGPSYNTNIPEPQLSIVAPIDGSTLPQLGGRTPVRFVAEVQWFDDSQPGANLRVNNAGVRAGSFPVTFRRAPGGDPFRWIGEAAPTTLRGDDQNSIEIIFYPDSDGRVLRGTTNFTLAAPVEGNLRVVGIEANQAVQIPGNRVPLIGDKRTVVRVFVQGTPDVRGPWGPVTGTLTTRTADGMTRTHSPLAPTTPIAGAVSTYGTDSQLMFLLDRPETVAGELQIDVALQPVSPRPQTNTSDDSSRAIVRFLEPLRYTAYGVLFSFPTGETNDWSKMDDYARYIENVFPVSSARIVQIPGTGTNVQMVNSIDGLRDRTGDLLGRLPPDVSIFGLWPGDGTVQSMCDSNGSCQTGFAYLRRTDAWGNPDEGPQVAAQELAHAEGLWWHADSIYEPAPAPFGFWNPTWPWYHAGIGHVGMDTRNPTTPMVVNPYPGTSHVHDFMSYGPGITWVSPYTFCVLLETFTDNADRCPSGVRDAPRSELVGGTTRADTGPGDAGVLAAARMGITPLPEEVEYLLVRGDIAWDAESATLEPIESVFRALELPSGAEGEAFSLDILDAAGGVLLALPFSPSITHWHDGEPIPFELRVRRPDGAASIVIRRGDQVLVQRAASDTAPTIAFTEAPTDLADEPIDVAWTATDGDGDPLTFAMEVSYDGRKSWLPVGYDLSGAAVTLEPAAFAGSNEAWLRVQASDGFNSAIAEHGPFSIAGHAPDVQALSPPDGASVSQGSPVLLEVNAIDLEDGALDEESIEWTSDRDGALGTGRWLVVETLTVGEHHITASATDTSGMSADVTLSVVVTASGGLVPVASVNPEPGAAATPSSNATPEPAIVGPSDDPTASGGLPIEPFALVAIALGSAAVGGWIVLRRQKLRRGGR